MVAILLAVQQVEDICSDSSSALKSLQFSHSESRKDIEIEVQQSLFRIQMMGLSHCSVGTGSHWYTRKQSRQESKKRGNK